MKNWTLPEPKPKCNNQPSFNTIKHNKCRNDARSYKNFNWINNRLIIVGINFEADAESRNYQKIYYRWNLSKIIICSITKYKVTIIKLLFLLLSRLIVVSVSCSGDRHIDISSTCKQPQYLRTFIPSSPLRTGPDRQLNPTSIVAGWLLCVISVNGSVLCQ